jgi:hypothetical protein
MEERGGVSVQWRYSIQGIMVYKNWSPCKSYVTCSRRSDRDDFQAIRPSGAEAVSGWGE